MSPFGLRKADARRADTPRSMARYLDTGTEAEMSRITSAPLIDLVSGSALSAGLRMSATIV